MCMCGAIDCRQCGPDQGFAWPPVYEEDLPEDEEDEDIDEEEDEE